MGRIVTPADVSTETGPWLGELLLDHRDEIVADWLRRVRALPHATALDEPRLLDHIPNVLDELAGLTDLARGSSVDLTRASHGHVLERIDQGFDLAEIITELHELRQAILTAWQGETNVLPARQIRMLDEALDTAIEDAVRRYASRTTAELREREQRFHSLADNLPQLAWMTDAAGQPFWFNQRWMDYTGWTVEDVRRVGWHNIYHPDHAQHVADTWQRAVAAGEAWEATFPLRRRDGYWRWFLSRAVPIKDASGRVERWFGTNTDVTATWFVERAGAILGRSLDYTSTLDQLAHLVIPDLADWCVVDVLEGDRLEHVAIAHADPSKVAVARAFARRYPHDPVKDRGVEAVLRTGRTHLRTEITDASLTARARDPEQARTLRELGFRSWIGAPLVARGRTFGVLNLVTSESHRHYVDDDLSIATELGVRAGAAVDNARLYRDTRLAVRAREEVLAVVSHDLRNPLGTIDLASSLLAETHGADPTATKQIAVIRRATDRMAHLLDDLLDMASINAGGLSLKPTGEDVARLLAEVVDLHEPLARAAGIQIVRDLELESLELVCDRHRIVQVFGNLLGNAIKFCRAGDTISVRCAIGDGHARFVIADTGPGIATAALPHIFEAYWTERGHGRKQGTGLGLFISKAIVEAHGGRLDVESEPGRGTTFTVTLPLVM
jgi:PAS domain S-box-containing protein